MTNMKCPSLSLMDFSLNSIFLDIMIAKPSCFLGPLNWNFFPTLYSKVMSVFEVEVCFL